MGPSPKLLQAQKGGSGHKNGEGWVGANSSFLSLGAVCDGGQGHPQNGGGEEEQGPPHSFWGCVAAPASPLPQIQGFSFPLEQGVPGNWGAPCPTSLPPRVQTSRHGGDRGSTPKPRRNRRNTPKSEGVPEEMEVLLSVLQDVPLKWGPPYSFFFPYFPKKLGGAPPKLKHPPKASGFSPFPKEERD